MAQKYWIVLLLGICSGMAVATGSSGQSSDVITIDLPNLSPEARPLRLVRIPAGHFEMGTSDEERGRLTNESPVRNVTIGKYFYVGETEITQAQWLAVMGDNPSSFHTCGDDCPVEQVSWNDCKIFIQALNRLSPEGPRFRLPSEAEWEYAARAGTRTRFSFGDAHECEDSCEVCDLRALYMWWCGNAGSTTHAVATKQPNLWGLYDMHGSVWEWCEDDWHGNYYGAPTNGKPWIDEPRGTHRVLRGGAWYINASQCRSGVRDFNDPNFRHPYYSNGVRVVADLQ